MQYQKWINDSYRNILFLMTSTITMRIPYPQLNWVQRKRAMKFHCRFNKISCVNALRANTGLDLYANMKRFLFLKKCYTLSTIIFTRAIQCLLYWDVFSLCVHLEQCVVLSCTSVATSMSLSCALEPTRVRTLMYVNMLWRVWLSLIFFCDIMTASIDRWAVSCVSWFDITLISEYQSRYRANSF